GDRGWGAGGAPEGRVGWGGCRRAPRTGLHRTTRPRREPKIARALRRHRCRRYPSDKALAQRQAWLPSGRRDGDGGSQSSVLVLAGDTAPEADHRQRCLRSTATLVHFAHPRPCHRLLFILAGEDAVADAKSFHRQVDESASRLVRYDIVVGCLPAQHAAKRDEAVEAVRFGGHRDGTRHFECTWHGRTLVCRSGPLNRCNRTARKLIAYLGIEARLDDQKMRIRLGRRLASL